MSTITLLYLPLLGYYFYVYWQTKQAKKLQDELIESFKDSPDILSYHRVYFARAAFIKRKLKLLSFEARGILLNKANSVELHACLRDKSVIAERYDKKEMHVEWFGNKTIGSSNLHWLKLGTDEKQYFISADTGFNAIQSREATADIVKQVFRDHALPAAAAQDFALDKNRASLTVVVAFFCLIAFAVVDGVFVNQNQLLNAAPIIRLLPVMYVFAIPVYWLLSKNRVPTRESIVLSILLSGALMGASIPAAKRIDQMLATGGPVKYSYELRDGYNFYALNSGAPKLCFPKQQKFWSEHKEGSRHEFKLWHGPLGLWQLDTEDVAQRYPINGGKAS